jgi:hypothetical protein
VVFSPDRQAELNVAGMMFELLREPETPTRQRDAHEAVPATLQPVEFALSGQTERGETFVQGKVKYGDQTVGMSANGTNLATPWAVGRLYGLTPGAWSCRFARMWIDVRLGVAAAPHEVQRHTAEVDAGTLRHGIGVGAI